MLHKYWILIFSIRSHTASTDIAIFFLKKIRTENDVPEDSAEIQDPET